MWSEITIITSRSLSYPSLSSIHFSFQASVITLPTPLNRTQKLLHMYKKIKIWDILSLCFQIKVSMHCYLGSWKSAFISLLKENCLMQHFWLVLSSLSTLRISSQSPHVYEVSTRYTYVESLSEFPFHIMSRVFFVIFNILPCYLFFNHFRHMNHNRHYPHFPVLPISSFIHVKRYLIHSCASVIEILIL